MNLLKEEIDAFICHSSKDKPFADQLAEELKRRQISIWYDKDNIDDGEDIDEEVLEGLRKAKVGVVILSKNFYRAQFARSELAILNFKRSERRGKVFPIFHGIEAKNILIRGWPFAKNLKGYSTSNYSIKEICDRISKLVAKEKEIEQKRSLQVLKIQNVDENNPRAFIGSFNFYISIFYILIASLFVYNKRELFSQKKKASLKTVNIQKPCEVSFENTPNNIKILVFPFMGKGNNIRKNEIENKIVSYYQFLKVDDITLECKSISCDTILDYIDADRKAKKYDANILVWGEYEDNVGQNKEIILRAKTNGFEPYYSGNLWWTRDSITSFKGIANGDFLGVLNSTINYYMGCRFLKERTEYQKALDYFKGVWLLNEADWGDELYYNMAECYKGLGLANKTVEYLYKAIAVKPNRPFLRIKLGFLLESFRDSVKQAKRQYEIALKIDSNYAYGHQQYAFFLLHQKGEYISFKKHMNKFISLTTQ